jgi:hypothetical protein
MTFLPLSISPSGLQKLGYSKPIVDVKKQGFHHTCG